MSASPANAWRLLGATLEQRFAGNEDALAALRRLIDAKITLADTTAAREDAARAQQYRGHAMTAAE
jgi:hypothetical protein